MNQEKIKSWAMWVAILAQVASILVMAGIDPEQVELWRGIVAATLEILVLLGILNNPNSQSTF